MEQMFLPELPCFLHEPTNVGNLISDSVQTQLVQLKVLSLRAAEAQLLFGINLQACEMSTAVW